MPTRPLSWRDVPLVNPGQAVRVNRPGLGAWRSAVPVRNTAAGRSRSGSGGGRGQANELERIIAEEALEDEEGFNFFNAGGRVLGGTLDLLDTPGAFVRSGIKELQDASTPGQDVSWDDFVAQGRDNITGSELLFGENPTGGGAVGGLGRAVLGFGVDVAADPLSYVTFGGARVGAEAGEVAARKFLTPSVRRKLGEASVDAAERAGTTFATAELREQAIEQAGRSASAEAAQKAVKFRDNRALSPLEREAIGAEPGTYLNVPGTRSSRVRNFVERHAGDRTVRMDNGRLAFRASKKELPTVVPKIRRKVTQNRAADAIASKFTRHPTLRKKMLYGTPDEAATAIQTLTKANAADLQEHLIARQWGNRWGDVAARLKKAGVSGEDARYALAADDQAEAVIRGKAAAAGDDNLVEDLKAFRDSIVDDANSIDPELPWLNQVDDYTVRTASDEMIALRGGHGDGRRPYGRAIKRAYGPASEGFEINELFSEPLLPAFEAGGRSVDRQIDDILRKNNAVGWFEQDLYKAMPAYIRRTSRRYKEEWLSKQLRDLGIAEPALIRQLTEAGVRQGRIRAALYKTSLRAKIRAESQARRASQAASDVVAGTADNEVAQRLQTQARQGAQEAATSERQLQEMAGVLDSSALREEEQVFIAKSADIDVRRQELMDSLQPIQDDVFRLGHLEVEASHKLNLETYAASKNVTALEERSAQLYQELGDLHERARALAGATDYRQARTHLDRMIAEAEEKANKIIGNESRYGPDAFDKAADNLARLQALTTDNVAFKAWADKQNNLLVGSGGTIKSGLKNETFLGAQAYRELVEIEERIVKTMGEIDEVDSVLHQFEDIAEMPTEPLDAQLADIETQLRDAVDEYETMRSVSAKNRVETLTNMRAGVLHQKGVIERARGRIADVDRTAPDLLATLDELTNAEAMGNKIIHTVFPDTPAEVHGSRLLDYTHERMDDLQSQVDDTQNAILGAYTDRDTIRVELSGIRQEKRQAERNLRAAERSGKQKDIELAAEQDDLLGQAEVLSTRANEIDDELYDVEQQIDTFGVQALSAPGAKETYAEALAERFVAAQEAKMYRLWAAHSAAEADSRVAARVADFWENKIQQEWSGPVEEGYKFFVKDSMKQLGAVSQTQYDWLVETLSKATVMQGPQGIRPFLRGYDAVLNLWKAYALATPGTVLRNLFGATFNNWLADVGVRTADYDLVLRWGLRNEGRRRGTLNAADRAIMEQLDEAGLLTGSATSLEIEKSLGNANWNPLSIDSRPIRGIRNMQERVENLARGALAVRTLRNGGTIDDAVAQAVKYHFNYEDLAAFERSAMRRVIPFYTWTRKNFPLMVEQLFQKPTKFSRFYQLRNEIEAQSPEEAIVPGYFGENLGVRLPFNLGAGQAYVLPDLPFTAINDVTDPTSAGSMAAPFVKVPLEYMFGRQVYKNIPLKDEYQPVPGVLRAIPGMMPALGAIGKAERGAEGWYMKQKDMYVLESMLPVFGRGRRLFPTEQKYDERVMTSWLSMMFGVGLRTNSPQEQRNAAYERVDRTLERYDSANERGLFPEGTKLPRPGQTFNAAYEYLGVEE